MGLLSAVFVCIPMIFHKFSVLLAKDCKNEKMKITPSKNDTEKNPFLNPNILNIQIAHYAPSYDIV